MTQEYPYLAEEIPADAMEEMPLAFPRKRHAYSIFAIVTSFLIMWIAPVFGGDSAMGYAMLGSLVICLWDAPACLFLLIASAGAYYSSPEEGASRITPTQIVAFGLMLRCLISPGLGSVVVFLRGMNKWAIAMLGIFFLGLVGTGILQMYLQPTMQNLTGLIVFLVVGMLAVQIRDLKWIAIPLVAGLFLPAAYYLLVWTHLLEAAFEGYTSKSGGELRVSGGRNDPNYVGTLISPCFAVLVLLFLTGKKLLGRLLVFGAMGVCFLAVADGGSRAALGAMVVGGAIAMYFAMRSRGTAAVNRSILLLVLGVIFAVAAYSVYEAKLAQTFERNREAGTTREEWGFAIDHIIHHAIPDPLGYASMVGREAHETFLTAGIEGGILAMFGLIGASIICIAVSWRQMKYVPVQDRIWQQMIVLIMILTTLGVSFITVRSHKVWWAMFALSGLSVRALGVDDQDDMLLDENSQGPA